MSEVIVSSAALPGAEPDTFAPEFQLKIAGSQDPEDVRRLLGPDTFAFIARSSTRVDSALMDAAPNLRAIARTGAGYDSVDVEEATRRRIPVLYTPDALTAATSEHTAALILAVAKHLPTWTRAAVGDRWSDRNRYFSPDLSDSTLGIVGYGRIGKRVHRLLSPFFGRTLVFDPYVGINLSRDEGRKATALDSLLGDSDVVTFHVPLTDETAGLLSLSRLARFKPGAVLVNAARGGLIGSHHDLLAALDRGYLSRIALDVLVNEPPDDSDPLVGDPRVLITPHVGSRTLGTQRKIVETLARELKALLQGTIVTAENIVNPDVIHPDRRTGADE